jgi:regulator of RNase E activity RraA
MQVNPKDWVVADELGVVFIPQHLVDEVFKLASEKQMGESLVRNELAAGQDIGEVFARHGIL